MANGDKVFVGVVTHKFGVNAYVGETEENVLDQLDQYVQKWWHEIRVDEQPESRDERRQIYFDAMSDLEQFEITSTVVGQEEIESPYDVTFTTRVYAASKADAIEAAFVRGATSEYGEWDATDGTDE